MKVSREVKNIIENIQKYVGQLQSFKYEVVVILQGPNQPIQSFGDTHLKDFINALNPGLPFTDIARGDPPNSSRTLSLKKPPFFESQNIAEKRMFLRKLVTSIIPRPNWKQGIPPYFWPTGYRYGCPNKLYTKDDIPIIVDSIYQYFNTADTNQSHSNRDNTHTAFRYSPPWRASVDQTIDNSASSSLQSTSRGFGRKKKSRPVSLCSNRSSSSDSSPGSSRTVRIRPSMRIDSDSSPENNRVSSDLGTENSRRARRRLNRIVYSDSSPENNKTSSYLGTDNSRPAKRPYRATLSSDSTIVRKKSRKV